MERHTYRVMPQLDLKAIEQRAQKAFNRKKTTGPELSAFLAERTDTAVRLAEVKKLLSSKKPAHIKYGVDPTAPDIHLGHVVQLLVLRELQKAGHKVTFIVGDFTATIGDPSGKNVERPALSSTEIKRNVRTYEKQAALVLDMHKVNVRFNSEWLDKVALRDFFSYLQLQTVASAMEREDFRKRESITRAEMLYATLQAIDSVELQNDIELGGRDQLLNFIEARELMRKIGIKGQSVLTTPLLPGTTGTGEKMSKSKKNYIAVSDSASDVFAKIMSVTDKDMFTYMRLLTYVSKADRALLEKAVTKRTINPRDVKQLIARLVTFLVHPNHQEVTRAEDAFAKVFGKGEVPDDIPRHKLTRKDIKDLAQLISEIGNFSRSEAKRLVKTKSVHVIADGKSRAVTDLKQLKVDVTHALRIGKQKFVKIILR